MTETLNEKQQQIHERQLASLSDKYEAELKNNTELVDEMEDLNFRLARLLMNEADYLQLLMNSQLTVSQLRADLQALSEKSREHTENCKPLGIDTEDDEHRRRDENSKILPHVQASEKLALDTSEGCKVAIEQVREELHDQAVDDKNSTNQAKTAKLKLSGLEPDNNAQQTHMKDSNSSNQNHQRNLENTSVQEARATLEVSALDTDDTDDFWFNSDEPGQLDTLDPQFKKALLEGLNSDTFEYEEFTVDEIKSYVDMVIAVLKGFGYIDTIINRQLLSSTRFLLEQLRKSRKLKMVLLSWEPETFETYFPRDNYVQYYHAGHVRIVREIKKRLPVLEKIPGVNYQNLVTLGDVMSAMIDGVREGNRDIFDRALVRVSTIDLLVDTWKGTSELGVTVIKNAILRYGFDFPEWKRLVDPASLYHKLLMSYEPRGTKEVKLWAQDSLTPKTSNDELLKLIISSLVPRMRQLGTARLQGRAVATRPEVYAEYSRIMAENDCHEAFYAVSRSQTSKPSLGRTVARNENGEGEPRISFKERRLAGDKLAVKVIRRVKEMGSCWNCFDKDHVTRHCPMLSAANSDIAAWIMPDYTEVTKLKRSKLQEKMCRLWNKWAQ